jgi:protein-S-isoprenylcysteine O-methyltransferase Ste14
VVLLLIDPVPDESTASAPIDQLDSVLVARTAASRWAYRVCDVLAGLTLLVWAAQWAYASLRLTDGVLPTMALFQAWVGALLLTRSPVIIPPRWIDIVLSAPSLLVSGLALKLAPDPATWPAWNSILFVGGAAWAMTSLGCLGRSFAIFPASRALVARGPYRLIRHPAYTGELAMILACAMAGGRWTPVFIPAAIATIVLRIRLEESALRRQPQYELYTRKVRWRLLPGVW